MLYDRLVSAEVLALANPVAEFVYAGKGPGQQEPVQSEIFRLLVKFARAGKHVVRLKSGDPLVFGRGAEEAEFLLAHGIPCEIVPGISSAIAVPGHVGIPVTYRHLTSSFTVVTGHARKEGRTRWADHVHSDTLVILSMIPILGPALVWVPAALILAVAGSWGKAAILVGFGVGVIGLADNFIRPYVISGRVKTRAAIAAELIAAGRNPQQPVAFLENGCTPREHVNETTHADVAAGLVEVNAPAIFIAGEVVRLRHHKEVATHEADPRFVLSTTTLPPAPASSTASTAI